METHDHLFIGGASVAPSSGTRIEVISPNTEEIFASVPAAEKEDIDRAVAAARTAFDEGPFPRWPVADRLEAIKRLSAALLGRMETIGATIASENGAPIAMAPTFQVLSATMALDACANIGAQYTWVDERTGALGQRIRVHRHPVGVCALVVPWNVPLYVICMKLGPALAAGCTAVVKAAPETPLETYALAEAVTEAGIPPGVVNIVTAQREASEHLVAHPGVDKVSFTGSTATGARIGEICGHDIRRCTLELGGKSAAIVLDDFDVTCAADLVNAGMMNNGQACAAQTRIIAPRSRYEEIVAATAAAASAYKVGSSMDPETQIGPLVAQRQRDRVEGMLSRAKSEGARAACGGGRPDGLDCGWFIAPTILADVNNQMEIAREEIFGPVVSVIPYDTEEEAVHIANDTPYGLGGGVWTTDAERGAAIATRMRTGTVTINHSVVLDFRSPFGGFKKSGIGREMGPEGFEPFVEYQSVMFAPGA